MEEEKNKHNLPHALEPVRHWQGQPCEALFWSTSFGIHRNKVSATNGLCHYYGNVSQYIVMLTVEYLALCRTFSP